MLGFNADSEAAISSLTDTLTNHASMQNVSIYAELVAAVARPARAIFLNRTKRPVFAAECYLGQLRS